MMTQLLRANGISLFLSWADLGHGDWCRLQLEVDGAVFTLGAEAKSVVFERLARALADELPASTTKIEGISATWLLSLAEEHSSVFAAEIEGRRTLFFQGPDGRLLARAVLSDSERWAWMKQ